MDSAQENNDQNPILTPSSDEHLPESINDNLPTQYQGKRPFLKIAGVVFSVFVLIIVAILLLLKYYNIAPFSRVLPSQQLGNEQTSQEIAYSLSQPDRRYFPFISCPLVKDQCVNGQFVFEDSEGQVGYGLKFDNLSAGSRVLASISGKKVMESANSFLITNTERGIELRYVASESFSFAHAEALSYDMDQLIGTFAGEGNTLTLYAKNAAGQPIRLGIGEGGDFLTNLE